MITCCDVEVQLKLFVPVTINTVVTCGVSKMVVAVVLLEIAGLVHVYPKAPLAVYET